jgi:2-methylcitrate dehydratase PrpD
MNTGAIHWSTDRLAAWAAALRYEDLPADVVAMTEDCVLDAIGCAIAGLDENGTRAAQEMAAVTYAGGDASVWFRSQRLNALGAAYANAAAVSALDIDDGHRLAMGHPGAAVVPSALAVGEEHGASGRDILTAIVAGYEICVRLGHAEIKKPYHTGNWTGFGAAVAAAKLTGLDQDRIAQALAITAYHSPRLFDLTQSKFMGADVKESIPWSVVTGLSAVELAARGFTGCRDALDLEGRFDPDVTLDGLGDGFRIMGTYFKNYSVCRWAHTSISGLVEIMREQGLAVDDIRSVSVDTFGQAAALNNSANPDNIIAAQYSLPFTMAVAAVLGEDAMSPLGGDKIGHPGVVALAERISIRYAPEMDGHLPLRAPGRVIVETASGRFEKTVITAWGDAGGETGRDDYRAKFMRLATKRISKDQAADIVAGVERLRDDDVAALSRPLTSLMAESSRRAG